MSHTTSCAVDDSHLEGSGSHSTASGLAGPSSATAAESRFTPKSEGRAFSLGEGRACTPKSEGRACTPKSEGRACTPKSEGRACTPKSEGRACSLSEVRWASAATLLFGLAVVLRVGGVPGWLSEAAFGACYLAGGWAPALAGLKALRAKSLDVDLLMVVAAIGAASIGQVLDGGLLIVIFATSAGLEAYATKRTADSVRELLTLAPEQACVLAVDGTERVVDTSQLQPDDVVVVRPGERIGADGQVIFGVSEVDQASITGEPLPVVRNVGDEVFAGTLNGGGVLHLVVTRAAQDSVVARIVSLVEAASATKAKAQLFVERIEQRYSVGVVVTTLAVFAIPLALGSGLQSTLLRAMTYMIVASPCAIVLATMPPLLAAIATAGRHGVLVKSAVVMEQLGPTTQVAFDKTGTLTNGTPRIAEINLLAGVTLSVSETLALAAAAERPSEHPIGRAILDAAAAANLSVPDADDFSATPGRGVTALVAGHRVQVGSPAILDTASCDITEALELVQRLEQQAHTVVAVLLDAQPIALLGLADQLRSNAARAVRGLTRITGRTPVLLTGDNALAAKRLADEVGIDDVRAALLPEDKVAQVALLGEDGQRVLVVGDGVNDAPALAAAYLGVAMGRHGSDLTLQTADAVLVGDDLGALPPLLRLSRSARRAVIQNLVLAVSAILGLVAWDLLGHLPLPLGVLGHEGGTVLIGLNGLRLLRTRSWGSGIF